MATTPPPIRKPKEVNYDFTKSPIATRLPGNPAYSTQAHATTPTQRSTREVNYDFTWVKPVSSAGAVTSDKSEPSPVGNEGILSKVYRWITEPVEKTAGTIDLSEGYDKIVNNLVHHLPKELQGQYSVRLAQGLLRSFFELGDFFTSPVGMGLAIAHLFPLTAPFAAAADIGLLGSQAYRTLPSVIDAIRDPKDPDKMAQAIKDIAFSVMGSKAIRIGIGEPGHVGDFARPLEAKKVIDALVNAPPDQKLKIADEIYAPKGKRQELTAQAYQMPVVKTLASVFDIKKPKLAEAAAYLVDNRNITIDVAKLDVAKLVSDFKREVPEDMRDVKKMGYVLEKSATPQEVGLSPEAQKWIPTLRDWNFQVEKMFKAAYGDDVALLDPETYLMHKWGFGDPGDLTAKGGNLGQGRRMLRDPQFRQRVINTYRQGIENEGYRPAMNDIADLLYARHEIAATAIANQAMANTLTDMGLIVSNDFKAQHSKDVSRWPTLESRPLERSVYSGRGQGGSYIYVKRPVRVHPEIKGPVEAIFGESYPLRDPGTGKLTAYGAMEYLRSFGKQQGVGFSGFHHWAIMEQAQAIELGNRPNPVGLAKTFVQVPLTELKDVFRGMKSGAWEMIGKPLKADIPPVLGVKYGVARDYVEHGLRLGTSDAEGPAVKRMMEYHSEHPIMGPILNKTVGPLIHGIGKIDYIVNRGLWDFYLPSQMMSSFDLIFQREMKLHPRATPEEVSGLKREIAKHTNKVFGTESLESIGLSPRARYWANMFLFAPVWTFSNFRILTNGFQTEAAHRLTGRWIGGAIFSWAVTSNLTNWATTSWFNSPDKNGKRGGHFIWDNAGAPLRSGGRWSLGATENSDKIFAGYNEDGSENYVNFGKGFKEPLKAMNDPIAYLTGKMGLIPKTLGALLFGREPGTDYQVIDRTQPFWSHQVPQYASVLSETVLPFTFQDAASWLERKGFPEVFPERGATQARVGPIPLGQPSRKGLSMLRAEEAYEAAMDDKSLTDKNRQDIINAIMKAAEINHLNQSQIVRNYISRRNRKRRNVQGNSVKYDKYGNVAEPPPEIRR